MAEWEPPVVTALRRFLDGKTVHARWLLRWEREWANQFARRLHHPEWRPGPKWRHKAKDGLHKRIGRVAAILGFQPVRLLVAWNDRISRHRDLLTHTYDVVWKRHRSAGMAG